MGPCYVEPVPSSAGLKEGEEEEEKEEEEEEEEEEADDQYN